ncbi:MAG: PAS domain S-box protein [Spirochaetia bacterium]|nr:PAS domain S-box protein [Spirochaetia bacterium]
MKDRDQTGSSQIMQRMLTRFERLCSVSIAIVNTSLEILHAGEQGQLIPDISGYFEEAEPFSIRDIDQPYPALAGMSLFVSQDHESAVFCPYRTQEHELQYLVITGFKLVREEQQSILEPGQPSYTVSYIINLLAVIVESVRDFSEFITVKQYAREEMRTNRQVITQLQLLMHIWKAGRWEYSVEDQRNSVDQNWKEIFGIPDGVDTEDFHAYFEDHIVPEDRDRVHHQMEEFLAGNTDVYHSQFRFTSETQGLRWIEGIGITSEYDQDGNPKTIIGMNRDVTEIEQKHQEIMQANKLLSSLLEHMPSGVFWKDVNSVYLGANDRFAHDAGVASYKDVIGKTDRDLPFVADEYEHYRADDLKVIRNKEPISEEVNTLYREDGRQGWSYTSKVPLLDDSGEVFGLLGVYTDISKLKWTEQQLAERERRLQAILDCSKDIIWIVDSELAPEYVSPSAEEILGKEHGGLLLTDPGKIIEPASYLETAERLKQLAADQEVQGHTPMIQTALEIRTSGGDTLLMDAVFTALIDANGTQLGYLGILRDMTEQQDLQRALQQSQKIEAIGRLAGGVAHDFNNLLQVILGYGELLCDTIPSDSDEGTMISTIILAGKRARILVEQLLKFSQQDEYELLSIDISGCVKQLLPTLRTLVSEQVELTYTAGDSLPQVLADRQQIEQLCINICLNADDAMTDGGTLSISIEEMVFGAPVPVYGESMPPGKYLVLSISDTGIGIQKEQIDVLFEPFYTTKQVGKGVGLGLAMVFGIVKEHNGFIRVTSEPQHWTTFSVYLPAAP